MGAYPQGNRKARTYRLICLGHLPYYKAESYSWLHPPRTDRYKSRYRIRRRFKRLTLAELLDAQRSKYMRTLEEVLGDE